MIDAAPASLVLPPKPAVIRPVEGRLLTPGHLPANREARRWALAELVRRRLITPAQANDALVVLGMMMGFAPNVPGAVAAAGGGFPALANITTSDDVQGDDSRVVTLPGSIVSGNLLIAMIACNSATTFTWPAGWTEFKDTGEDPGFSAAYRFADGSEGASITVTVSNTIRDTVHIAFRATGAHASTPPEITSVATSSTATPNPPSITPSWGAADTLFLAIAAVDRSSGVTLSAYPTNYALYNTDKGHPTAGSTSGGRLSMGGRELNATSADPGTFTFSASHPASAHTIAIRPA